MNITKMSRELILNTDLPYTKIIDVILEAFPQAKTSTKSLASTARDLRKAGYTVPNRGMSGRVEMTGSLEAFNKAMGIKDTEEVEA